MATNGVKSNGSTGSPKGRFIVVGAGYAGLATAIELRRRGHEVEVFESTKALTKQGDSIQLSSYAARIISKWGDVLARTAKTSSKLTGMTYWNFKGDKILDAPLPAEFSGFPILYCSRGETQNIFYDYAVSIGVKFRLGIRVSNYFEEDNCSGIIVGDERIEADGVIAADGIHSLARTFLTGKPQKPQTSGFAIYRAWFNLDSLADDPITKFLADSRRDEFHVWLGKDTHAIVLTNVALRALVCFVTHKDTSEVEESWNLLGSVDDALAVVDGWDPIIRSVIRHIPPGNLIDWKLLWRDPAPQWVSKKGRITLAGDSAHPHLPTSGAGGGQAIEDGATIGALVEVIGTSDIPLAFNAFQKLRYERTSLTQLMGWETRHRWHQTDWDKVKENPSAIKMPQPEWLYGGDAEKYVYDNIKAVIQHLKEGNPFVSTNVPEGHVHEEWTVETMMAKEKEQADEAIYKTK